MVTFKHICSFLGEIVVLMGTNVCAKEIIFGCLIIG